MAGGARDSMTRVPNSDYHEAGLSSRAQESADRARLVSESTVDGLLLHDSSLGSGRAAELNTGLPWCNVLLLRQLQERAPVAQSDRARDF